MKKIPTEDEIRKIIEDGYNDYISSLSKKKIIETLNESLNKNIIKVIIGNIIGMNYDPWNHIFKIDNISNFKNSILYSLIKDEENIKEYIKEHIIPELQNIILNKNDIASIKKVYKENLVVYLKELADEKAREKAEESISKIMNEIEEEIENK